MNTESLWNNPDIERTIAILDPELRFKYQKFAQQLYNKASDADPQVVAIESSSQIKLMLRDGLPVEDLTPEERQIFIDTFGEEALKKYE
jgi:hypothetical protein